MSLFFTIVYETEATFGVLRFFSSQDGYLQLQSNSVNTDTEGAIESVHINGVSLLSGLNLKKNARTFLPQRQSKLSVIMMCPYKARFECSKVCQAYFVVSRENKAFPLLVV